MQLRRFPFVIQDGFSKTVKEGWFQRIWRILFKKQHRYYPYSKYVDLRINFAPGQINVRHHPQIKQRLIKDFGARLSLLLHCGTDDFGKALREDHIGLGHVWAEIYSIILYEVAILSGLGDENIYFLEEFNLIKKRDKYVVYRIKISMNRPFPYELVSGLEHLVTDYLNALAMDRPFEIRQKMNEYIDDRQEFP